MPRANTQAMRAHLREISCQNAPGAHAVLLLDRDRVFGTYNEIIQATCQAWNRLIEQPWRTMSLGPSDWAPRW